MKRGGRGQQLIYGREDAAAAAVVKGISSAGVLSLSPRALNSVQGVKAEASLAWTNE